MKKEEEGGGRSKVKNAEHEEKEIGSEKDMAISRKRK